MGDTWIVDADDIRTLQQYQSNLLYLTPSIRHFLENDDAQFLVTAPKGFGKTLLLIAKRGQIQRENPGVTCIPNGQLLDKAAGDIIFNKPALQLYGASARPWENAWTLAISLAAIKAAKLGNALRSVKLPKALTSEDRTSPFDHLSVILGLGHNALDAFNVGTQDVVPIVRRINSGIAIFIDNVDEYFKKHIEPEPSAASSAGETHRSIWHNAQAGLVQAAYTLHRLTHHLKVYATIRKEAFAHLVKSNEMSQQYAPAALDLRYSKSELEAIVIQNIRREKPETLSDANLVALDPLRAFFGCETIRHPYTKEDENIFSYLYRHTLGRPRDFMTIGQRISRTPSGERDTAALRTCINDGGTIVAKEYLAEIARLLPHLDFNALWAQIPKNILTRGDIESIWQLLADGGSGPPHVFCALFRAGLVGVVEHDSKSNAWMQRFAHAGQYALDSDCLPKADYYLLHPILEGMITQANPQYVIDASCVVGDGYPWMQEVESPMYVLKGDVKGYSLIMEDAPRRRAFQEAFEEAVRPHCNGLRHSEIKEGDSILAVHDDSFALVQAALNISLAVQRIEGRPLLRIAVVEGLVEFKADPADGGRRKLSGGTGLRTAARMEPMVKEGEIWVTENVKSSLVAGSPGFVAEPLGPDDATKSEWRGGQLNLKKSGSPSDPDLWVRPYRIMTGRNPT